MGPICSQSMAFREPLNLYLSDKMIQFDIKKLSGLNTEIPQTKKIISKLVIFLLGNSGLVPGLPCVCATGAPPVWMVPALRYCHSVDGDGAICPGGGWGVGSLTSEPVLRSK